MTTPKPPPGFELIPDIPPPPEGFKLEQPGYLSNLKTMALEGTDQFVEGMDQLTGAFRSAASGSGPDTRKKEIGDLVRGFGNTVSGGLGAVYSPVNAALRTYVGQPVADATGSQGAGTAAEIATGFFGPSAITRGARLLGRSVAAKPSGEEIRDAATAGFQSPVVRNLEVRPAATQSWAQTLRSDLTQAGLDDIQAAGVWRTLERLDDVPAGASVTGNNLQSLRASLNNMAKERGADFQSTPNAEAARRAIDSLDNLVVGMRPRDVIAGNPQQAAAVWGEARGDWAQYAKIRAMDRRQMQAEGNAAGAHSGLNFDNTVRQRTRDIATGPEGRGFNLPGERQAVEQVAYGSPERNTLRVGSNMLGGGGGIGSSLVGVGGAVASGNPWAMVSIPAGIGMRATQNALAGRDLDRLSAVLSANSPLARQQGGVRQDMARALMGADLPPWAQNAIAAQLLSRPAPFAGK